MSENTKIDDGGPAFPCAYPEMGGGVIYGMTLRDWFAGQALGFYLTGVRPDGPWPAKQAVAESCYLLADAMLAARAGGGGG